MKVITPTAAHILLPRSPSPGNRHHCVFDAFVNSYSCVSNYGQLVQLHEKKRSVWARELVRLGRIFSLCFVTSVFITGIMGELPNPNACRGDGGILGAGSGRKESGEG